jgi:hypothetical protein
MWQEKLKQALDEIGKSYVSGCIEFYGRQKPDPWQQELDTLEAMIKIGNATDIKKAIDAFETNCKGLLARYKK